MLEDDPDFTPRVAALSWRPSASKLYFVAALQPQESQSQLQKAQNHLRDPQRELPDQENLPENVRCKVSRQLHALQPCSHRLCQHETITPEDWDQTSQPPLKSRFSLHVGHTDMSLVSISYPVPSQSSPLTGPGFRPTRVRSIGATSQPTLRGRFCSLATSLQTWWFCVSLLLCLSGGRCAC